MAEVRPIPSAVGAFEAQVIDFNKTYNAIVQNAAAIRRQQAQAQKDIEKQLDLMMADKRTTRSQDDYIIRKARMDAQNFYYDNKANIDAGGSKLRELKQKMGTATSLITKSVAERVEDEKRLPVLKEAMKDGNYYEDDLTELVRKLELPLNEREGLTFDRDGVATPLDQFNVTDFKYFKKFEPVKDLYDPITRNVKSIQPQTMDLSINKKLGINVDNIKQWKVYDPISLVNLTNDVAISKSKGFLKHYEPELAIYKTLPQQDRDLELKGVIDAYKDMSGTDMTSWFAKQGGPGIDNEVEYAAFQQLQNHLPKIIKDTYDYRTQSILLKQWQLNLARSRFAFQKEKESEEEGFDATLTKAIKSGKFNKEEWNAYMNGWSNIDHPGASGVRAGGYNFSDPDANGKVTVTYYTQVPLKDAEGKYLTSASGVTKTQADQNVRGNSKLRSASTNVKAELSRDGIWYAQMERTVILDPKAANLAPDISNMNSYVQDAIPVEAAKTEFKEGRKGRKWKESKQFIPENE